MDITYTARSGGIRVSGHNAGSSYTISGVLVTVFDPRETTIEKSATTLDGEAHSVVERVETLWTITTDIIDPDDWDNWRELAASCGEGDAVTVDPGSLYGMQSGDIDGYIVGGVRLSRVGQLGDFRASFTVREPQ